METAIQVVWWIGLIGALVLTLIVLKQVAVLLRVLRDIQQLAELTREAARGLAGNAAASARLAHASGRASGFRDSVHALARAAGDVQRKLRSLKPEE